MPPTAACPGCGATLPAPPEFAGKMVRCGRCGRAFPLPAPAGPPAPRPVAAAPAPRPVLDAVPVAPAAPPRRTRRPRDEDEDDRPVERRPPKGKGFPVLLVAVVGGLLLLLGGAAVVAAVLVLGRPGGVAGVGNPLGGVLADSWTRETIPGTDCSVEIPGKTESTGVGLRTGHGQATSAGVRGEADGPQGGKIALEAAFMGLDAPGKPRPPIDPVVPSDRLVRRYEVQGHKATLVFKPNWDGGGTPAVVLWVAYGTRGTIVLAAAGKGVNENHPTVKRFVESVRFGPAVPAPPVPGLAPKPPAPGLPAGPTVWERTTLAGTRLSVEVPARTARSQPDNLAPNPAGQLVAVQITREAVTATGARLRVVVGVVGSRPAAGQKANLGDAGMVDAIANGIRAGQSRRDRLVRRFELGSRPAVLVVRDEKAGGRALVLMNVQEGGLWYTLSVDGPGIDENTPEVKRFLDSARFDD